MHVNGKLELWKKANYGCPDWQEYMLLFVTCYFFFIFLIF